MLGIQEITPPVDQIPSANTTPQISQEVLDALNLTPQDIENHNETKKRLEQAEISGKNMGIEYYNKIKINELNRGEVKFGHIIVERGIPKKDIADHINQKFSHQNEQLYFPVSEGGFMARGFFNGLGNAALQNKDWTTAITSIDIINEGGILKNETTMNQLKQAAIANKEHGVKIAEIIQNRLNLQKPQEPQPTPSLPINNPTEELREAPPAPTGMLPPTFN